MTTKYGIITRLQIIFLAVFSPKRLITATLAGFLQSVDKLDDDQLKMLVKELNDAN